MYKKILLVGLLSLGFIGVSLADDYDDGEYVDSDSAVDFNSGIYFGGQAGIADLHYKKSQYSSSKNTYDKGYNFAARGYFGYSFTKFISAELGYNYYGRPKFKNPDGNTQDILQHGIDLMVKANLPLDYGFAFYIKGGLAWVYRSALRSNNNTFDGKDANNKFTPVGALGVNYWFASNMAIDLCWAKTMTIRNLPTIDLITLGFVYRVNI